MGIFTLGPRTNSITSCALAAAVESTPHRGAYHASRPLTMVFFFSGFAENRESPQGRYSCRRRRRIVITSFPLCSLRLSGTTIKTLTTRIVILNRRCCNPRGVRAQRRTVQLRTTETSNTHQKFGILSMLAAVLIIIAEPEMFFNKNRI